MVHFCRVMSPVSPWKTRLSRTSATAAVRVQKHTAKLTFQSNLPRTSPENPGDYEHFGWHSLPNLKFADQPLESCVNIIHVDIIEIWNLHDRDRVGSPQRSAIYSCSKVVVLHNISGQVSEYVEVSLTGCSVPCMSSRKTFDA